MRQASWEDIFKQGSEEEQPKPPFWSRFPMVSWEDLVTLAIVMVAFLTVVRSVDNANWVPEMPSLYLIAFLGLSLGLLFSYVRISSLIAHFVALALGFFSVLFVIAPKVEGVTYPERMREVIDRVYLWGNAVFSGGISNDNIPFVVLVVGATFLASYVAAWSIFRWYNAWLALVPGGLALLTNISYLPGQRSLPLLIYLFCAILLVARVNLLRQVRSWRKEDTRYPDFLSLHVLNVTVWVGIGLLALAWMMPVGQGGGLLYSAWTTVTSPVAEPMRDLGRVFSAVDAKRGGSVHQFGSTLPLQGEISLGGGRVMEVTASETGFLRAQTYDLYSAQGWRVGPTAQITAGAWPALRAITSPDDATRQLRRAVSLQVTTSKRTNIVVSAGQPLAVNIDTRVVFGPGTNDVTSVRPSGRLDAGDQYRADSSVSNASANALRNASRNYPAWTEAYLQLPDTLPARVRDKARELATGAGNPYDMANQIEQYLRGFAVDTKIQAAPARRDSVDYFLFEARRGYFDYHASAMVVMLRSLGIPARLAVGYTIKAEDRIPQTSVYVVHESNAFAWPEVYFPGLGWIEFNPTPSEPPVLRSGADGDFFPGFDPDEQFFDDGFFLPDSDTPVDPAEGVLDELRIEEDSNLVSRIAFSIILGMLAITILAFGTFQYNWQHGLKGLPYPVQVWEKTLRLARWTNVRPLPQETPREVMMRLRQELPEVNDLGYLEESYVRSRYGQKELKPEEQERLAAVWTKARNNLLSRLLRWR
jgi:transglutaminase-like putative cysteine protease